MADPAPAAAPAADIIPAAAPAAAPAADIIPAAAPAAAPAADKPLVPAAADLNLFEAAPAKWREHIAGDDTAKLNQLNRYATLEKFTNTWFDQNDMIRKGEIKALESPGDDGSDDDWGKYRDKLGIPETADKYELELDEGLTLGDTDKALMAHVYEAAHAGNVPAHTMSNLTNALLKGRTEEIHKLEVLQGSHVTECTSILHDTWRSDYDTNINMVKNVIIGSLPENVQELFAQAMMPDGRKILNSPEVLVAMADWARKINPAATVVPNTVGAANTMDAELAALKKRMGDDEWYKDEAAQKRYRQLLDAKEQMQ